MIIVIDNYDSFTYNLVQYFGEIESDIRVFRNDTIDPQGVQELGPDKIVISPGPCTPNEAGNSSAIIKELGPTIPTLGVCLGHQCIGAVYGGEIIRAETIMHGKTSQVTHTDDPIFKDIESPFQATRYHSLIIKRDTCPDILEVTAETEAGEIMGVAHREFPIWGLQFHPESILTNSGKQLIRNFMSA